MNSIYDNQNDIIHSGVAHDENPPGRGSGRFGWGTGENPYQHMFNFLQESNSMKKAGMSDADIAKALIGKVKVYEDKYRDATVNDLKAAKAIAETELRKRAIELGKEIREERKEEMVNEFYEQTNINSKKEQAIIHDSQTMGMDTAELAERYGMDEDDVKAILGYN